MIKKYSLLFLAVALTISMMQASKPENQKDKKQKDEFPWSKLMQEMPPEIFNELDIAGDVAIGIGTICKEAAKKTPAKKYQTGFKEYKPEDQNKKFEIFYVDDPNCGCFGIIEAYDNERLSAEERVLNQVLFAQLNKQGSECTEWKKTLTKKQVEAFDQVFDDIQRIFDYTPKNQTKILLTQESRKKIEEIAAMQDPEEKRQKTIHFFLADPRHGYLLKYVLNNIK
ncbi:hypothetical protein IPH25_04950 [bacterium]|nr:MAG: hypothetical protein IPG37_01955 [bacterium]QQR61787.1 MAG: hypothetical protein IPH25_04950 [bacterium]QQR62634.1 MAG: hypothetical protein IPH67_04435 [bacterium]